MTPQDYENVRAALEDAIQGKAKYQESGLCSNLVGLILEYRDEEAFLKFLSRCFTSWPEFSGDRMYPVSAAGNPEGEYDIHVSLGNQYGEDAYGLARRRLAAYVQSRLEIAYTNQLEGL